MNQSGNTSCHAEPQYLRYRLLFQHSLSFCIYEKRFVPVKEQNVFIFSITDYLDHQCFFLGGA